MARAGGDGDGGGGEGAGGVGVGAARACVAKIKWTQVPFFLPAAAGVQARARRTRGGHAAMVGARRSLGHFSSKSHRDLNDECADRCK